jgi:hypothetical protein
MPFLRSVGDADKVPHVLAKLNTGTGRTFIKEGSYKGMLDAFGIA